DPLVTGVQTWALPISPRMPPSVGRRDVSTPLRAIDSAAAQASIAGTMAAIAIRLPACSPAAVAQAGIPRSGRTRRSGESVRALSDRKSVVEGKGEGAR